jgi:hypothetical protein
VAVATSEAPAAPLVAVASVNETPVVANAANSVPPVSAPAVVAPAKIQPTPVPAAPKPAPAPAAKIAAAPPVKKPSDELITVGGAVYYHAHVEKVDQNGIVISYTLQSGGLGMTEVDASDLPNDLRQKYKFNTGDSENH